MTGKKPVVPAPPVRPAPASPVRLARLAMLAAVINHPEIFDIAEEGLASLQMDDGRLDALRQALLTTLGGDAGLDAAGLQAHLLSQGFDAELKSVLNERVYSRSPGVEPGAEAGRVMNSWQDICRFLEARSLMAERQDGMQGREIGFHGDAGRSDNGQDM